MKITESQVTKLVISEAKMPNGLGTLDPIAVYLEDYGPGEGKITITCFGEAWSHYWSHMGEQHTLKSFFSKCDEHYLAGKLKNGIRPRIQDEDSDALEAKLKQEIVRLRREGELTHEKAREYWNEASYVTWGEHAGLYADVFGDEWWYDLPEKPNPDYEYLCQIIKTVQAALSSQ